MGYAVHVCIRSTPGVYLIVRSSCMVFYFIIFYYVRRRWCFWPSSECSGRKLTKTLLWYVASTQKYVKRIIYFFFSERCKLQNRKKMPAFHHKDLFKRICGQKWRVSILYVSVFQWSVRTPHGAV